MSRKKENSENSDAEIPSKQEHYSEDMAEKTVEVDFPTNGATRMGLIALFREAEEVDEQYDRKLYPNEVADAFSEIYNNLEDISGITLTVEFE